MEGASRARGFSCATLVDSPGHEWNGFVHTTNEPVTVIKGRLRVIVEGRPFIDDHG